MGVVLQIFGALFLALIVAVVVLILVVRAKARKFLKSLTDLAEQAQRTVTPARIQLVPMAVNDWDDPDAVRGLAEPLGSLGFEKVGDFEVRPVEGLRLEAWMQPEEAVTAVVYEHPQAGVWLDLVTRYEDGTRITYANSSIGGVDHAPGHTIERFAGMPTAEMYRKFLAERPQKAFQRYGPDEFAAVFEKAYADEMDWRNARGGPTDREMRAVAALSGQTYSEETLTRARERLATQAAEQLSESLRERFLATSGISAPEWERIRDRVVVIHDNLTREMVDDIIYAHIDEDEIDEFDFESESPITEQFAAFNKALSPDRRFRLLGTLDEPVPAAVYCASESE